jgi:hypothetical protein
MNTAFLTDDIIEYIDNLKASTNTSDLQSTNPLIGIITPEWHYSDSVRIFGGQDINWNNIDDNDLIHKLANNVGEGESANYHLPEFEKNFAGWYQSYHFLPREKWGIHISYSKWLETSRILYKTCPSLSYKDRDSVKAGFLYLYKHLLFHYITENASSIMEIISEKNNLYKKYLWNIYSEYFNTSECLEELLANSYLWNNLDECHIEENYFKKALLSQGLGYKNFNQFIGQDLRLGFRLLLSQIKTGKLKSTTKEPLEQIMDYYNPFDNSHGHNIPIWLHYKARPLH